MNFHAIIKGLYARVRILNHCMHKTPLKFYRMVKELKAACILKVLYCKMTSFVQQAYSESISMFFSDELELFYYTTIIMIVILNP